VSGGDAPHPPRENAADADGVDTITDIATFPFLTVRTCAAVGLKIAFQGLQLLDGPGVQSFAQIDPPVSCGSGGRK